MTSMKSCRAAGEDPVFLCPVFVHNSGMDEETYLRGIRLFNSADYFEAHEVLEDVWRAASGPEKKFLQGLIQVAVALHHHSNGNVVGARSLLVRATKNLSDYPENFGGIQLPELLHSLAQWQEALAEGTSVPSFPRFVVSS
jgi:predicted metal-dependent hydrolase